MKAQNQYIRVIEPARIEWIAVGDASRFIVFEKRKGKPFSSVRTFTNDKAHLKISDLEQDRPGRSFDSFTKSRGSQTGAPRHAYVNHQDPKEHAIENFVREVAAYLDSSYKKHSFNRLILVADGRLLGKLRAFMNQNTVAAISGEHEKDFAWVTGHDLEDRVQALMIPQ